jgi:hypothetical protein
MTFWSRPSVHRRDVVAHFLFTSVKRPHFFLLIIYIHITMTDRSSKLKLMLLSAFSALLVERLLMMLTGQLDASDYRQVLKGTSTSIKTLKTKQQNNISNVTQIYQLSDGADMFENVCLVETTGKDEPGAIFSYNANGTSMNSNYALNMNEAEWAKWTVETTGRTLDQWIEDSKGGVLVEEETLLFMDLWKNPAHCLTDNAFSLAVDMLDRGQQDTTTPLYKQYLHAGYWRFHQSCPATEDSEQWWCCAFMEKTGLLDVANGLVKRPSGRGAFGDPMCFRKLIVPRLTAYRYPLGQKVRDSVLQLQKRAFAGLPSTLTKKPWDEKALPEDVPILLYDRRGAGRRVLVNSEELTQKLEERYHVKIHLWGEKYNELTFTMQAMLFNKFPRVIAPHGAHLTNLFFSRPGSKTMEIACPDDASLKYPKPPNYNLTSLHQAKGNKLEWYGDARFFGHRWFAGFARGIFIEHFVYEEFEGCKEDGRFLLDYSPKNVTLDVEAFIPFVETRFGLKPRDGKTRGASEKKAAIADEKNA